jgi:transcriptional regulator GlxA family with amidase domain
MKIEKLDRRMPVTVAVFGFDGVSALDLTGPLDTFATANRQLSDFEPEIPYQVRLIGVTGKSFVSESGIVYKTQYTLGNALPVDTIVIPGGQGIHNGEASHRIAEWLNDRAINIRRITCVCGGIYPVAKTGLLDSRKVATHWALVNELKRRCPKLDIDPAAPFVKDGRFYSCGGGAAAVEMTLALIQEDYGVRRALAVARQLVMRLRPPGDRENAIEELQFECGPLDRFAELPAWIASHLSDNLSVETLALRVCLCPRHFSRIFKRLFHASPASFVEQLRLDEAKRRLRVPRNTVENVARDVGYQSADSFRRAFERRHGVSPLGYKKSLRSSAASPYRPSLFAA